MMVMNSFTKSLGLLCLFLAISFVFNLTTCAFSPIQFIYGRVDPACFYVCGKAWAHGLLPYVEFTDVKGPLLFLLFRLGYEMTPDSLNGMFVIYTLAGSLSIGLLYRIARMGGLSVLASVMTAVCVMDVAFWRVISVSSAQSELLMLPSLVWMMGNFYDLLKAEKPAEKDVYSLAWSLGIGSAFVLLVKFSGCVPFVAAFGLTMLLLLYRRCPGRWLGSFVLRCCAGAALLVVPTVILLLCNGMFGACWQHYFAANFQSYFGTHSNSFYSWNRVVEIIVNNNLRDGNGIPTLLALAYLFLSTWVKNGNDRFVAGVLFAFAFSVYLSAAVGYFPYYFVYCAPLLVFPFISLCSRGEILVNKWAGSLAVLVVLGAGCVMSPHTNLTSREDGAKMETLLSTVKNPRVIYWRTLEQGFGYRSGTLPACRVWFELNGMEESYYDETRQCIRDRQADFIFTDEKLRDEDREFLLSCRYRMLPESSILVYGTDGKAKEFVAWTR